MQQSIEQSCLRSGMRNSLLGVRRRLDPRLQDLAAIKIASKVSRFNLFQQSHNIACYLAVRGEASVAPLIQRIWELQKTCYISLLDPQEERHLCFMSYSEHDRLQVNKYGILQPIYDETKILPLQNLDLLLVPLVGFDIGGNRLGHGGGYYDYTLREQKQGLNPYLLGVAYEWQKLPDIAVFPWDVKLNAVVTDEAWYVFS